MCPFMLDQFYWAERMYWLGVSPEPLSRHHLLPDKNDDRSVQEAAHVLSLAIHDALSSRVKTQAIEIAERLSLEVIKFVLNFDLKTVSLEVHAFMIFQLSGRCIRGN